ncbi:hypothetical protein ACFE04_029597 [Oxalis oulophora]
MQSQGFPKVQSEREEKMNIFGESSFVADDDNDSTGQHNHHRPGKLHCLKKKKVSKRKFYMKRKRLIHITLFKALSFLMIPKVASSIKIKKEIKEYEAELRREASEMESLEEIKKTNAKKMMDVEKRFFKVKADIARLANMMNGDGLFDKEGGHRAQSEVPRQEQIHFSR